MICIVGTLAFSPSLSLLVVSALVLSRLVPTGENACTASDPYRSSNVGSEADRQRVKFSEGGGDRDGRCKSLRRGCVGEGYTGREGEGGEEGAKRERRGR